MSFSQVCNSPNNKPKMRTKKANLPDPMTRGFLLPSLSERNPPITELRSNERDYFLWTHTTAGLYGRNYSDGFVSILGSVSKDAFEWRTSNGSGLFAFLGSDFAPIFGQIVSTRVNTLSTNKIVSSRHIIKKRASLPVDVHRPKNPFAAITHNRRRGKNKLSPKVEMIGWLRDRCNLNSLPAIFNEIHISHQILENCQVAKMLKSHYSLQQLF